MKNEAPHDLALNPRGLTHPGGYEPSSALLGRIHFASSLLKEVALSDAPAHLLYRDQNHAAHVCPVTDGLTVGRTAPAHLTFPAAAKMSGQHFRVAATERGFALEDMTSRNGTHVNGNKVQRDELTSGDLIEAGGQVFCFIALPKL